MTMLGTERTHACVKIYHATVKEVKDVSARNRILRFPTQVSIPDPKARQTNTLCPKEGRQYTLRKGMEQTRSKVINMYRSVSYKHSCGNEDTWANPTDISKREETTKGNGANPFVCQIVPHLLKVCKYKMSRLLYLFNLCCTKMKAKRKCPKIGNGTKPITGHPLAPFAISMSKHVKTCILGHDRLWHSRELEFPTQDSSSALMTRCRENSWTRTLNIDSVT